MNDYQRWLEKVTDPLLHAELTKMDPATREDAFYKDLEFGTGGLRGILGAGSNRLNVYTVAKISQGIASYIKKKNHNGSVAISYDSRINSTLFAQVASAVYAANGLKVHLFKQLEPTPVLSFATRFLHCSMGVMITASHNPKQYNGYKVYGSDGCQLTLEDADAISKIIESLDVFDDVRRGNFAKSLQNGDISYIKDDCLEAYMAYILTKQIPAITKRDLKIVYSPLNGTGLVPVTAALNRAGFKNVTVVPEQRDPDGTFRTCPKPNPELEEALHLGLQLLEKTKGDLLLVTDPDCDRVGTAIFHHGQVSLINGNEMGILLYDFLLKHKKAYPGSLVIKTIVTSDLIFPLAEAHHMKVVEVLTGFKFIGEQIGLLEKRGQEKLFFLGFEESYGYLTGTQVRDKDAVDASLVIAQMFQSFKDEGKDALDRLEEIYKEYGYVKTALDNFEFPGESGAATMRNLMARFHEKALKEAPKYAFVNDYLAGFHLEKGCKTPLNLPESDVLKFGYADGSTVTVRPSGTEPKLKVYYYVTAPKEASLAGRLEELEKEVRTFIAAAKE